MCVNGQHIQYDADASVSINDQPATAGDLELGQIVWIDAVRDREDVPDDALPRIVGRISFFLNSGIRFVEEIC